MALGGGASARPAVPAPPAPPAPPALPAPSTPTSPPPPPSPPHTTAPPSPPPPPPPPAPPPPSRPHTDVRRNVNVVLRDGGGDLPHDHRAHPLGLQVFHRRHEAALAHPVGAPLVRQVLVAPAANERVEGGA